MSIPTAFADRLINMSIHNGLVRMEVGIGQAAVEEGKQTTKYEATQSIVMPLDGFATALRLWNRAKRLGVRCLSTAFALPDATAVTSVLLPPWEKSR